MAVHPLMNAGMNGVQSGLRGVKQAAQDIAELNVGSTEERGTDKPQDKTATDDRVGDLADAIADLKLYERQVQASAKVVETADAVIGMLLDTQA